MKRMTMVLALLLSVIGTDVYAQDVVDLAWVDSVEVDSVALAEDFPAIDSLILARSYDVLGECMSAIDGIQGQVAVIDARTSDVLAWGALEKVEGDIVHASIQPNVALC